MKSTARSNSWDVVILTDRRYINPSPGDWYIDQIFQEEGLVASALESEGLRVLRADWSDPAFDWSSTRCAVFRSTWDYFDRFPEFSIWLERTANQTMLLNAPDLLRWNIDKHYLRDVEAAGVSIVPTHFVDRGQRCDLVQIAQHRGWDQLVIKPAVSGAARLTFRAMSSGEIAQLQSTFAECVQQEDMLVQPFQPEIVSQGEASLILIAGRYTHAIRKTAKAGDFRVQDDHGGVVHTYEPSRSEIEFAERAVAACPIAPLYARVDFVSTPEGCRLMELELIEPELFFRFHPPAAAAMGEAIIGALECAGKSL